MRGVKASVAQISTVTAEVLASRFSVPPHKRCRLHRTSSSSLRNDSAGFDSVGSGLWRRFSRLWHKGQPRHAFISTQNELGKFLRDEEMMVLGTQVSGGDLMLLSSPQSVVLCLLPLFVCCLYFLRLFKMSYGDVCVYIHTHLHKSFPSLVGLSFASLLWRYVIY